MELDKDTDPAMRGVSMLIRGSRKPGENNDGLDSSNRAQAQVLAINFKAKNITMTDALVQISAKVKLDVYITSVGIVICPQGEQPFPNFKSQKGEVIRKLTTPSKPEAD
jgi:hypothetical protein